jgi:hypothetical protein
MELTNSVMELISEHYKPYGLDKDVLRLIEETSRELEKDGIELTEELILKGLRLMLDLAESEALRHNNIERFGYFLSKAVQKKVLKNYLTIYIRFKGVSGD